MSFQESGVVSMSLLSKLSPELVKRSKMERFISVGYLNDNLYLKKIKIKEVI